VLISVTATVDRRVFFQVYATVTPELEQH